jgi:hypothetical protein
MADIIGSIDNAYQGKISVKVYHLIFTASTMYKCDVMDRKDLSQSYRNYLKQNPIARLGESGMMGPLGSYEYEQAVKQAHFQAVLEAEKIGLDLEKNLDSYLSENPGNFEAVDLSNITKVALIQGQDLKLPRLMLESFSGEDDYKLMHNNFEKLAKLDAGTIARYSSVLEKVFRERFISKDGSAEDGSMQR